MDKKLNDAKLQHEIHSFGSQGKAQREQFEQMLAPRRQLSTEEIKSKINSGILRELDAHLMQRGATNPKWMRSNSVFAKQYTETIAKNISMIEKHLDKLERDGVVSKDKFGTYTMSVSQYDGLNYFKSTAAIQDREKLAGQFAGMNTGNMFERADNWIMSNTENTFGGALKDFSNFHSAFTKTNGWGKGDPGAEALVEVVGGTMAVAALTGKVLTKATTRLAYGLAKTATKAIYGTSKGMTRVATKIFSQKAIKETTQMKQQMLSDKKQSLEKSLNDIEKSQVAKDPIQNKVEVQQTKAEKNKVNLAKLTDKKKMLTAEIKKVDKQIASLSKEGHQKAKASVQTKSAAQSKSKINTSTSSLKAKAKEELNKPAKKEVALSENKNKSASQPAKPFSEQLSKSRDRYEAKSSQSRNVKNKSIDKGQKERGKIAGQNQKEKQAQQAIKQAEQQAKAEKKEKSR